jgi:site-specific recombinase XerD
MRTQDLYGLDLANLNLRTGLLLIVGSKGDRDREVKFGALALVAVAAYLGTGRPRLVKIAARRMAKAGQKNSLDGRLTANGIYQILSRRWNEAGRKGTFGAHRLRHGLATLLVEANVSLAQVSAWLGHSLETTTMLYAHPTATAIHVRVGPVVEASLRDAGYAGMEVA